MSAEARARSVAAAGGARLCKPFQLLVLAAHDNLESDLVESEEAERQAREEPREANEDDDERERQDLSGRTRPHFAARTEQRRRAKFSTALAGNREGKKRGGERENDIEKNTRTPRRTRECAGLMIDVVEAVRARFTLAVLWCWSRDGPVATTTSVVVCRSLRVCDDDEVGEEEHRRAPPAAQHGGGLRSESERRRRGHVSEHLENRLMRRGGGGDGGRASRVDIWRPY